MPPKVSSSSGRGGRTSSNGKDVLLALLEPVTKKTTASSSGSPTQTGSSTQKGKLEGYGKTENNKQYPPLQRHAFVKWWSQFDTSKAAPDQVKNWFQSNPEFLKPADPETSLFLNQKSQLAAFLASSKSKEILAHNLKEVLQLLQQEEDEEPPKKEVESSENNDDQDDDPFYQNEDDCFGISLDDD
ncbi:hypothetical protein GYH30_016439 [Glycine max]|nr:hypothetical protein GYH30_016439 [Glycine max]